jgi:hypothetical protein
MQEVHTRREGSGVMQLTINSSLLPEKSAVLTLRLDPNTELKCSLCQQRPPRWFDDPAAETAMNPTASPLEGSDCCAECLNTLLELGVVEITQVDPDSF